MAAVDVSPYECPVCAELFKSPKLLPCDHLVCRSCVISWIQTTGGRGKCPICRAPILSAIPQDQGRLEAQVDRLHSDLATQALANSHKILSDTHECTMCKNNVAGHNFCLQCSVKLCTRCTLYHQELPASADHTVEQLSKLTVKTLAARHQVKCKTHTRQVVELYCPSHGELMCCRCGMTTHRVCSEVKEIEDAAKEERRKFKDQLRRLKERKMAKQLSDAKQQFKSMRKVAKDVFDDLSESVEKQRRDVNNLIQAEEDTMMASLAEVEKARMSMDFPLRNIENLVLESPDDGLLEMLQQLVTRLDNLESQMEVKDDVRDVGCLVLDDQIITRLKSDLAKLGRIQQPQSQPTSTPTAGVIPTTSATASGRIQQPQSQPTSTPAAGVIPTTRATASGRIQQTQNQLISTPAVGVIPTTSATASGRIQQPQNQPISTLAAGVIPTTSATPSVRIQQPQSQPTSTPAAGVISTTSATASGRIQQTQNQLISTPAVGVIPTTSFTASGRIQQPQNQPISTPAAGVIPTTSATASGRIQQPQSQPTSTPAAGVTPITSATVSGPTTAVKPQEAALARILKVGDRVKLAPGFLHLRVQSGDTGTVTAIPSRIQAARDQESQGCVDVHWDRSGELCHRMGRNDEYDLILD